jgi:hypothetical protein
MLRRIDDPAYGTTKENRFFFNYSRDMLPVSGTHPTTDDLLDGTGALRQEFA